MESQDSIFSFLKIFKFLFKCVCVSVWVYATMCVGAHGDQKRKKDPLELELWKVVSHHVGAEDQT